MCRDDHTAANSESRKRIAEARPRRDRGRAMTPREVIAKADVERKHEHAAESAMRWIRLGGDPRVVERKRRVLSIRRSGGEHVFTGYETRVLYEALDMVREHHRTEAEKYEAMVTTKEEGA